jgi:hypothetical protein
MARTKSNDFQTYIGIRTTDGLGWLYNYRGSQVALFLVMASMSTGIDNVVDFSAAKKKRVQAMLGLTSQSLIRLQRELEQGESPLIVRISYTEFMLNPDAFIGHNMSVRYYQQNRVKFAKALQWRRQNDFGNGTTRKIYMEENEAVSGE